MQITFKDEENDTELSVEETKDGNLELEMNDRHTDSDGMSCSVTCIIKDKEKFIKHIQLLGGNK